jgi:hypothetical protein
MEAGGANIAAAAFYCSAEQQSEVQTSEMVAFRVFFIS